MTDPRFALNDDQILRYSRQLILPGFGGRAQQALLNARIAVAGDGVAARLAAVYLAAAGVGTLVLPRRRGESTPGDAPDVHPLSPGFLGALNPDVRVEAPPGEGPVHQVIDLREGPADQAVPSPLGTGVQAVRGILAAAEAILRLADPERPPASPPPARPVDWGLAPSAERPEPMDPGAATVAVVGVGGLGCPASLVLALSGVGRLILIDDDAVDPSNLQRQVLYRRADVGRPKVEAAAERLRSAAPGCEVVPVRARLAPEGAPDLLADADVVIEGSDDLSTKFAVNDACVRLGIRAVIAGAIRTEAQVVAIDPGRSACYRCLFQAPPQGAWQATCAREGVLGAAVGTAGAVQALEALKLLTGEGRPLLGALWLYSAREPFVRTVEARRRPDCAACGRPTRGR